MVGMEVGGRVRGKIKIKMKVKMKGMKEGRGVRRGGESGEGYTPTYGICSVRLYYLVCFLFYILFHGVLNLYLTLHDLFE